MQIIRLTRRGQLGRALHLALVAALVALAGCGGGGSGGSTGGGTPPPVVLPTISISTQPADQSVMAGAPAAFKLGIVGTANVQWQSMINNVWTDIAGATSAEYTIAKTSKADNARQFRAIITAAGASPSSLTSSAATLTVTVPIAWTMSSPSFVGYGLSSIRWVDDRIAIAVGGNGVIARTADAGLSWSLVRDGSTETPTLLSLNVLDAKTIVAAGNDGSIIRSADAGLTWSRIASPTTKTIVSMSFRDALNGIAADAEGKLLRSSDGGLNWTTAPALGTFRLDRIELRGQLAMAYGWDGAQGKVVALRSTDSGASWSSIDFKQPFFEVRTLSFAEDNTMFATGTDRIARSTDGGLTWKTQFTQCSMSFDKPPVFTAGGKGISAEGECWTTDGGLSWTPSSQPPRYAQKNLALSPAGVALSVGSQGQIQRSSDFGATWSAPYQSNGLEGTELRDVAFSSEQEGLVVGRYGNAMVVARTTDGGLHWSKATLPAMVNTDPAGVAFADARTAVVAAWRPLRTTDGGQTWKTIDGLLLEGYFATVRFSGASLGIMTDSARVLRSTDAGLTWTEVFRTTDYTSLRAIAIRGSTVMVGGLGVMLRSTDAGLTWKTVPGFSAWVQSLAWVDDQRLIAVTTQGKLVISIDAGLSWTPVEVAGASFFSAVAFSADGKLGFLAGGGNLLRTTDGGQTWTVDLSGRPYNWNAIGFAGARNPVMVGYDGAIMTGSGY